MFSWMLVRCVLPTEPQRELHIRWLLPLSFESSFVRCVLRQHVLLVCSLSFCPNTILQRKKKNRIFDQVQYYQLSCFMDCAFSVMSKKTSANWVLKFPPALPSESITV